MTNRNDLTGGWLAMDEETSPEDDQDKPSNPFSGLSGDIKDRIEEERIATQEGERQVALDFIRIFRVKEKISSLNGPRDSVEVMLGGPLYTKILHKDPVTSISFVSNTSCASVGMDQRIHIWDPISKNDFLTLEEMAYNGHLVSTREKDLLACGSLDKTVQFWSLPDFEHIRTLDLGGFGVLSLAIDSNTRTIATGLYNGNVRISDLDTLETRSEFRAHDGTVTSLDFSRSGMTLVSGSDDGSVNVWRPATDTHVAGTSEYPSPITRVKILDDERTVIIAGENKQIQKWNSHGREMIGTFSGHSGDVHAIAISPDQDLMASASKDNTIRIWDIDTCVERKTLRGSRGSINDVRFSPDGDHLFSGNSEGEVAYWGVQLDVTQRVLDIVEEMLLDGGFNVKRTRKQTVIISLSET